MVARVRGVPLVHGEQMILVAVYDDVGSFLLVLKGIISEDAREL